MVEYSNECKKKKNLRQSGIYPFLVYMIGSCRVDIDLFGDAIELYYRQRPTKGTVEILGLEKLW